MSNSETSPAIYVGTYEKYNNGSIFGAWLKLADYDGPEEFYAACKELHKDEEDPEFMFQDYECFPESLYSESGNVKEIYEYIESSKGEDINAIDAFIGVWSFEDLRFFKQSLVGPYESEIDFTYQYTEARIEFIQATNFMQQNFHYEAYCRSIFINDFKFNNGYVFRVF